MIAEMNPEIPQAIEVEQQILGAMLGYPKAAEIALDMLKTEVFCHAGHKMIFRAMVLLFEKGVPIDLVTVTEKLRSVGYLEQAGGSAYLATLLSEISSGANIAYHARIVQDRFVRRKWQEMGKTLQQDAADLGKETAEIATEIDAGISSLVSSNTDGLVPVDQILLDFYAELEEAAKNPNSMPGVPTGLTEIDSRLFGLQPAELIILAARPSVGKTALALQVAYHAAHAHPEKGAVVFFSVEMPRKSIVTRMVCSLTRIEYNRLRSGKLEDREWVELSRQITPLSKLPLLIDDTAGLSIFECRARLRLLARKQKISLVVVDYLQLMSGKGDNREQEISSISRGLKAVAKEVQAPVLALSQMNRAIENRVSKMPQLSDLRESGSLEQDADAVIFLSEPTDKMENQIELSIAKSRNGPKGCFSLGYFPSFFHFTDPAPQYRQEPITHWTRDRDDH